MPPPCTRWGDVIVDMSVWRDVASLNRYVYGSAHVEIMRRRKEWFQRMKDADVVLWWVRKGHRPTVQEAIAKLELQRQAGPSEGAFTFRRAFPAPDAPQAEGTFGFGDECPATWCGRDGSASDRDRPQAADRDGRFWDRWSGRAQESKMESACQL